MKVLFLNENIGGHATVHLNLRAALQHRHDVEATFVDVPAPAGFDRLVGARIPGLARLDLDLQPLRAQLARSAWLGRRLRPLVGQADAVHLYTHNAGLLSAGIWRRHPTVVSLDTTNAQNAYRLPSRRPTVFTPLTVAATKPFERRVYRSATAIVANSRWAADSLRDDYGLAADRYLVLPFGIAAPDFGPGPAPGPDPEDPSGDAVRPRATFVGRSLSRKGGHQLLRVQRHGLAHRLDVTLVTEESPPPQPGVEVVRGVVPGDGRVWDILRRSSMFVFPSEIDMAPNAVIEAMMAGLPVVARPVGAIPEMVEDGVTGILVGPGDQELTEAITHLLDHPEQRLAMGAAARRRAMAAYHATTTTDALLQVLADAVAQHRRDRADTGSGLAR